MNYLFFLKVFVFVSRLSKTKKKLVLIPKIEVARKNIIPVQRVFISVLVYYVGLLFYLYHPVLQRTNYVLLCWE